MWELEKIIQTPTPLQRLQADWLEDRQVEIWVKRDDLTHPNIMGNKWRKWQGHLRHMQERNIHQFCTFGGAHSNHIWASAALGQIMGFRMKAFIRGDELNPFSSPTLRFATQAGMELVFLSRADYRHKKIEPDALGESWHIVPEGGSGPLAWEGFQGLVNEIGSVFQPDAYVGAMGTGGSLIGLAKYTSVKVIGVPALKGIDWNPVLQNAGAYVDIWDGFHEGGYAKKSKELMDWMQGFQQSHGFALDSIYTAKAFRALEWQVKNNFFPPHSRVVFIHSGGLTGDYTG